MKTKTRALETVLQLHHQIDGMKRKQIAELRAEIKRAIEDGLRAEDDYAVVLAALCSEREAALLEACGALCALCKCNWGRLVMSNETLYHYGGEIEYASGATQELSQPCKAAVVRKLMGEGLA